MKSPIEVSVDAVSVDLNGLTPTEVTTVRLAAQSFGFLLRAHPTPAMKRQVNFDQFADQIAKVYSLENPKTARIVSTLRDVHQRHLRS